MKPNSKHDLYFNQAVRRWDEAIPLGNGLIGCLVWGSGNPLRLSLDRADLWDERAASQILATDFNYKELINLVRNKNYAAIKQKFEDFCNNPAPTKIPAGRIELDFGILANQVESHLSLYCAEADIRLVFKNERVAIKTFIHAAEPLGCISINGSFSLPQIRVVCHNFSSSAGTDKKEDTNSLSLLGYPPALFKKEGDVSWFLQKTAEELEFAVVLAKKKTGTNSMEAAYTIAANFDGANWLEDAKNRVREAVKTGFENIKIKHEQWWKEYWEKSSIRIPEKEVEKQWYLTNYLFGSSSRKGAPPMPLQGVWTEDDGYLPPWKGDYHLDLNVQMSYWHYLKANHISEGESLLDFLWNLVPMGRKFARDFFDAPGICMPSVMSLHGKPLGGWVQYSINLMNQAWLCEAFNQYWRYTGNQEFLKNRAYPYLKESAECILHWLKPGADGKLKLPLSSSPEIHGNNPEAWLTPNSNYDLTLLINLFKSLRNMAEVLKNGESNYWNDKIQLLPEFAVNENKILMFSPDESLKESHRHFSHAMAIYPLNLLDYHTSEKDREIIDATIFDLEILGTGLWVGYSFPWMAELYARQGNGEAAFYQLYLFWENFCSQNGFHLNGDFKKHGLSAAHYRPFTLEGNMAAADALQEMLLQTYKDIIRVFPAVPKSWRNKGISFHNFRGEKGILVSAEMKNDKLIYIKLKTERDGVFKVQNIFNTNKIIIKKGGTLTEIVCPIGEIFDVVLRKNSVCILKGD